jgi:hypothetical protein
LDERERYTYIDFLQTAYLRLSELMSSAVHLPLPEVSLYACRVTNHLHWEELFKSLNEMLPPTSNIYREIYDPYSVPCQEPVTQSISDDLVDIYFDLIDTKNWPLLDPEGKLSAIWNWRFGYETHGEIMRYLRFEHSTFSFIHILGIS